MRKRQLVEIAGNAAGGSALTLLILHYSDVADLDDAAFWMAILMLVMTMIGRAMDKSKNSSDARQKLDGEANG